MQNHPNVVLITGAARRIGAVIARILHQSGMNIVVQYRSSKDDATQLCNELNAERAESAIAIYAELTNSEQLTSMLNIAIKKWGQLDALVNNASEFFKTTMGEVTEASWEALMNSNLKAPFFLSQMAAPYLKQSQGCIVNIADIHAASPLRDYAVYCISKAGLVMMTQALAKELGPTVRVNAVSPGAVAWPEGVNTLSNERKEKIIQNTLLRRHGSPEDIAKAVLYFIRDADFVTGQVLAVDGGRGV